MRICFTVQRYGAEVAGGAEAHCREFAERLVERGHEVTVATTTALGYVDWSEHFRPGWSEENGVLVHRLPVDHPRDNRRFGLVNARVATGAAPLAPALQREWLRLEGPMSGRLTEWLRRGGPAYDVVVFVTYLYATTGFGLPVVAGRVPTLLHPTAHDEPSLRLSLWDHVFRLPDAFAFLTEEEADLVRRRFHVDPVGEVVGVGVDLDRPGDGARFRALHGLGTAPYLLFVGRLDPGKGSDELYEFFVAYKQRHGGDLRLVLLGDPVKPVEPRPDVIVTGFVDEAVRDDAIAGATALVQPSYFESFSMVLTEAFAQARPALVQANCAVLAGHARRSGAALPYTGFGEFAAAVDLLLDRPHLAAAMGEQGRAYVEQQYAWPRVLDRYESLLARTASRT